MQKTYALLILLVLTLTGCQTDSYPTETVDTETETTQTVFTTDFADACNGIAVKGSTAYTETAGTHPVLLFGRDSSKEDYYEQSFILPEAWQVDWQNAVKYELVSCVTATPTEMGETCEFDVEGQIYTLESYGADYSVDLYAAETGEKLASTTLSLPADVCPSMYYFTEKTEQKYPDYTQEVTEFLKPYVQK